MIEEGRVQRHEEIPAFARLCGQLHLSGCVYDDILLPVSGDAHKAVVAGLISESTP